MSPGQTAQAAIELRGVSKSFGPVKAVRDVSLAIPDGAVAGIVGENGAGKSTLMNLVYGLVSPDAGEMLVRGREAVLSGPGDAIRLGIGMVHQHFMLVDTFTVAENVALGAEGSALLRPSLAAARRALGRIADEHGLRVDPDAIVGDLPVGEQQRVEILKVLYRGARILILDEPTAVLTPGETDALFRVLRGLSAGGVTVVLVTHKLREIMAATDGVFVMRGGRLVASRPTRETSPGELATLMIGDHGRSVLLPDATSRRRPAVQPEGFPGDAGVHRPHAEAAAASGPRSTQDAVSLDLRAGEIVGVAGVAGNGQGELLEVLAGMRPLAGGRIGLGGREVTPAAPCDPAAMRALGVAHVPEHRHRHGIVEEFTAAETAILGYEADPGLGRRRLDGRAAERSCAGLMARFDVRPPDPRHLSGRFSGGNQQKLVIGREISARPRILLVGQPTRGVDIGAIAAIHREIRALRDEGCAILLVSAELDEIAALADRVLVMLRGRIAGEVPADADPETLGLLMSGAGRERDAA